MTAWTSQMSFWSLAPTILSIPRQKRYVHLGDGSAYYGRATFLWGCRRAGIDSSSHSHMFGSCFCVWPISLSMAPQDPDSQLYGMPVIKVWNAKQVYILKRSLAAGYAGAENPLFFKENAALLLNDAKTSCDALRSQVADHFNG